LFAEKERALVTLASIADGVITTDTEGWIDYMNPGRAGTHRDGSSRKRAGLPIQALFRLVDEMHQRNVPNPIEMVLREERTIEVAANMLLLAQRRRHHAGGALRRADSRAARGS
jgi:hypothetical protein